MKWAGEPPTRCQLCEFMIITCFVDGRTKMGPWAFMCVNCHKKYGVGLGIGGGQLYEKQPNGEFHKKEG